MSVKEPELHDFGITSEEYDLYNRTGVHNALRDGSIYVITVILTAIVDFAVIRDIHVSLIWGYLVFFIPVLIVVGIVWTLISTVVIWFKRNRLLKSPVAAQIKSYEEAYRASHWESERRNLEAMWAQHEAGQQRRQAEERRRRDLSQYWESLGGYAFEREVGNLYRNMGYRVELTPKSGDQGIDLILMKEGKTTIVQCKRHKRPVGPAVARELYGSLIASGADNAILACTGGFTRGVEDFVKGKPITLISALDLVRMNEIGKDDVLEIDDALNIADSPPICPTQGCGRNMVLRMGRYRRFWGCPRYPGCRGTRDI